jgi:anti-anti-sigma factor
LSLRVDAGGATGAGGPKRRQRRVHVVHLDEILVTPRTVTVARVRTASPDGDVRVDISLNRGFVVLIVAGEVDASSAAVLHAALHELKPGQRAVLDMSRMICRDSTAVDLLVEHSKRMNVSGGALLIRCPTGVG